MELSQSRTFETEGRKETQDFLSLYPSSSPVLQDPTPLQGGFLKTQDFLQPLERVGKSVTKEENKVEMTDDDKLPPPSPPPSGEHLLPGGIGTYSISYFDHRDVKPEGILFAEQANLAKGIDEHSNSCLHKGSGFTLWDESATKKGKTGKENISGERHVLLESAVNVNGARWPPAPDRPTQSFSSNQHNTTTFSSFLSSQPSSSQKNQSFFSMIQSTTRDQDYEDDDEDKEFILKKEPSSQLKGNFPVKAETKNVDQKPNTPRSKHSATEQRRRSKINDRFQNLREIVPNSDQRRDKASFLLEVIEYIQFLQEKVIKYESPYNVWNQEQSKMMQWRNCHMADALTDHLHSASTGLAPASVFASEERTGVAPSIPINRQTLVEPDTSIATTLKEKGQKPEPASNAASSIHGPLQPNSFTFGTNAVATQLSPNQVSSIDKTASWAPQFRQNSSCADYWTCDALKEKDLTVESGAISISSVYSQRLLSSLTQALQNSGVDLSEANVSVQIDLGKRANGANSSVSIVKGDGAPARSRVASTGEFGQAPKRPRTI